MSSSTGWYRVVVGLQKVAQAAARETSEDVGMVASRAAQHGFQMASRVTSQEANNAFVPISPVASSMSSSSSYSWEQDSSDRAMSSVVSSMISSSSSEEEQAASLLTSEEADVRSDQSLAAENTIRAAPELIVAAEETTTHIPEGRAVPSSRFGRAMGFASLGAGLALGTAVEGVSRLVGKGSSGSIVVNDANADRFAASLCRMRGAALKLGQMLSIQDESLLPPALTRALEQVRKGADAMPHYQLEQQMTQQLGSDWRTKFERFDDLPFAAASIGQVHRATIRNGAGILQEVVVKVQYPGVAESIESDLYNISMLVKWSGLAPKGLFLENVLRVGQAELKVECSYQRELVNQERIRRLVQADPYLTKNRFVVPDVMEEWSTEQVLTSEFRPGGTIDKVSHLDQEERNRIGRAILYVTFQEIFGWRFMQTDPNWGNFLYDVGSQTTSLIDFGATREYSKPFVDGYLRIVWASANRDEETLMEQSHRMHFLTGQENAEMLHAHKSSGFTVGEPFWNDEPFDFRGSKISTRMGEHLSVFLKHRLTAPPEEVYSLHRKIAGAFMLNIKLGSVIQCRDILEDIVANYNFEDGMEPPSLYHKS
jgi:aarF domain-containing kinase